MKLIKIEKKCINNCKNDIKYKFEYKGECYEKCPSKTKFQKMILIYVKKLNKKKRYVI